MNAATARKALPEPVAIDGDTPTLRLFSLLEVIARKNHFFSLPALVEETGLPKPTLHRMLQQLESAGMIQREADGRHYGMALRLRRLGEDLLFNSTVHGARHAVLRTLVDEVGESCNITALSGGEVLYLDRVETPSFTDIAPGEATAELRLATGVYIDTVAALPGGGARSGSSEAAGAERAVAAAPAAARELAADCAVI